MQVKGSNKRNGEWRYWIALPKKEVLIPTKTNVGHDFKHRVKEISKHSETMLEWHRMPDNVYLSKEYPICPKCNQKFVPIKDYKRCFKCRFT